LTHGVHSFSNACLPLFGFVLLSTIELLCCCVQARLVLESILETVVRQQSIEKDGVSTISKFND